MKKSCRNGLLAVWLVMGMAGIGRSFAAEDETPAPPPPPSANHSSSNDLSRLVLSPGLREIIKMVRANVAPQVLTAYISNSSIAYDPTADEIIALRKMGVPDNVLVALLTRGSQLRTQFVQTAQDWSNFAPPQAPEPAPPYDEIAPPTQPRFPGYFGGYPPYGFPWPYFSVGPTVSFNNSFPTYINGQAIYSGYYVPGYGIYW